MLRLPMQRSAGFHLDSSPRWKSPIELEDKAMNRSIEQISNRRVNEVAGKLDAISLPAGPLQGWFRQVDGTQRKREFDSREERRLERIRIAGELHDTLLQGFLGASLVVGGTLQQMAEDSPARASLDRAAQLMKRAIEEGRAVLQGLRSSAVAPEGVAPGSLEQEFSDLLREVAPASGAQTRILVTGQPRALKPEIQRQIYLIGREALVNALRHSKATRIEAEVAYLRSHLRVVVRDNGCGIDAQIVQSGRASHWGLLGMRDRARGIGAEVRIFSRRGAGTEVEITLCSGIAAADDRAGFIPPSY
jgi:signal transduction histidine kinase